MKEGIEDELFFIFEGVAEVLGEVCKLPFQGMEGKAMVGELVMKIW